MASVGDEVSAAASSLPDDILVDILARVPYSSLCRFKCVSKPWRALCSDPELRKKALQTLSGFFVSNRRSERRFLNLSGKGLPLVDPSLPFLSRYEDVQIVDCCGGLLLCKCIEDSSDSDGFDPWADYVVCNPATEKWIVLPYTDMLRLGNVVRLGFDPAVPTRFQVFMIVRDWDDFITGLQIYSSDTGEWTSVMERQWRGQHFMTEDDEEDYEFVFFNGTLHFTTYKSSVLTVDTEGKTWRNFLMPHEMKRDGDYGFIGQSQGCLYAMHIGHCDDAKLSVWVLKDYDSGQWILKHTVDILELLGRRYDQFSKLVAIHPERNLVYFVDGMKQTLMSYDMDSRKVHVLCASEDYLMRPCLPYIPCFTDCLSDGWIYTAGEHGMASGDEVPAVASLPEDILVDILARVPYSSLCRFKCVSKPWRTLCSDPELLKKALQTLSGFFVSNRRSERRFLNLSGKGLPLVDPSLPFLSRYEDVQIVDCCGGLLLCKCIEDSSDSDGFDPWADYVVCNPATEKWIVLPYTDMLRAGNVVRLGFDPAVPTRFQVFMIVRNWDDFITGLQIYSSDTGEWTSVMERQWRGQHFMIEDEEEDYEFVFFNGTLHFTTYKSSVLTVDTEGKTWRNFLMPHEMKRDGDYGFIGQSQGCLYAMHIGHCDDAKLSVWVLKDYDSGQWILKHSVDILELLGRRYDQFSKLVAIHPERNLVYFVDGMKQTLMSYDMDSRKVHVLCASEDYLMRPCLPYIPCFTDCLSDGK